MTGLSLFELIQISRSRLSSKWAATSAAVASLIWGAQLAIEGTCSWGFPATNELAGGGLCPWYYHVDEGYWPGLTSIAWVVPWVIIPVICM